MFCNKCGTENEDESKFCSSCGNGIEGVQTKGDVVDNPVQSKLNRGDDEFYGLDETQTMDEKVDNEEKIPWDHVTPKRFLIGLAVFVVIMMIKTGGESASAITPSSSTSGSAASSSASSSELAIAASGDSKFEFGSPTVASYMSYIFVVKQCGWIDEREFEVSKKKMAYIESKGNLSIEDWKFAINFGMKTASDILETTGGCSGQGAKNMKRNYYEFSNNPALSGIN
jgi:hypothetical protein